MANPAPIVPMSQADIQKVVDTAKVSDTIKVVFTFTADTTKRTYVGQVEKASSSKLTLKWTTATGDPSFDPTKKGQFPAKDRQGNTLQYELAILNPDNAVASNSSSDDDDDLAIFNPWDSSTWDFNDVLKLEMSLRTFLNIGPNPDRFSGSKFLNLMHVIRFVAAVERSSVPVSVKTLGSRALEDSLRLFEIEFRAAQNGLSQADLYTEVYKEGKLTVVEKAVASRIEKGLKVRFCSHCKTRGHLVDTCHILHPELKKQKKKSGNGRGGRD
jgi:hypothetical protein